MNRAPWFVLACACLVAILQAAPSATTVLQQFLTGPDVPLTAFRAVRHLEAETRGGRMRATLEARTTLTADGHFWYEVLGEDGSSIIRNHVLRAALERERVARAKGETRDAQLNAANYAFEPDTAAAGDVVRVGLHPRRADELLLDGSMFLLAASGDLQRVEGTVAKRPSFWTRRVDIVRRYARVAGVRVPVLMESVAQILIVGRSTFAMKYDYETVNGITIQNGSAGATGSPGSTASTPAPR